MTCIDPKRRKKISDFHDQLMVRIDRGEMSEIDIQHYESTLDLLHATTLNERNHHVAAAILYPVRQLSLWPSTRSNLKYSLRVDLVCQLVLYDRETLLGLDGIGKVAVKIVEDRLENLGLRLAMNVEAVKEAVVRAGGDPRLCDGHPYSR